MKVKEFKSSNSLGDLGNRVTASWMFAGGSIYITVALFLALNLMISCVVSAQDADQEEAKVQSGSYESFKLLTERNIFDPQRSKPIPFTERVEPPPPPPREESFALVGVFMNGKDKVAFFEGTDRKWSGARKVGESIADFVIDGVDFSHALLVEKAVAASSDDSIESTDSSDSQAAVSVDKEFENEAESKVDSFSEELTASENVLVVDDPENRLEEKTIHLMVGQSMKRRGDSPWDLQDSGAGGFRSASPQNVGSESTAEESIGDEASTTDSEGGGMSDILRKMMERRKQEMNK